MIMITPIAEELYAEAEHQGAGARRGPGQQGIHHWDHVPWLYYNIIIFSRLYIHIIIYIYVYSEAFRQLLHCNGAPGKT